MVLPKESCVFLPSIEDQKEYLVAKRYFPQGTTLSDDDRDMLACSNFHYLLGYFRNYNKYKSEGFLPEKPDISDILDIVRMDVEVSSLTVRIHEAERTGDSSCMGGSILYLS